jgi:hypothetical protein
MAPNRLGTALGDAGEVITRPRDPLGGHGEVITSLRHLAIIATIDHPGGTRVKTRAALTARCGETARRGLVAFLEYGSALEWLIGAGKRDPLAQAARRLGSPRRPGRNGPNSSKWFDMTLGRGPAH